MFYVKMIVTLSPAYPYSTRSPNRTMSYVTHRTEAHVHEQYGTTQTCVFLGRRHTLMATTCL